MNVHSFIGEIILSIEKGEIIYRIYLECGRNRNMKRLAFVLEKVFGVLFATFLIGVVVSAFHGAKNYDKNLIWKICCAIVILFFIFIVCSVVDLSKECSKKEVYKNVVSIFTLSWCIHMLIIWAVGQYTEQFSDFANALALSQNSFPLTEAPDHYRIFSNWALYPLYLKLIQALFGQGEFSGIFVNAILCAVSSTLIYILCHLGIKDDRIGYLAAVIYTFWPSHLLYSVILTPEFLNIFLTLFFGCCMYMTINHYNKKIVYLLTCLSAVTLALSGFFKSIDKVILIALSIMTILSALKEDYKIILKSSNRNALYKKILIMVIFVGSYIVSNKLIFAGLDYSYGEVVNRNPTAHFVYIGLNPETYGIWNENVSKVYEDNVINCNYDYDAASDLTYQRLKKEIKEKGYLTAAYFENKFLTVWENNAETYWVNETIKDESPFLRKPEWFFSFGVITQIFWLTICFILCIEGLFLLIWSDNNRMIICLILFGFACLMLLTEVQARYKCVMYPILSILAADGIIRLNNVLKTMWKKKRRHTN